MTDLAQNGREPGGAADDDAGNAAATAPRRKRRILFVADEQRTLDGPQRMLRGERDEWEIAFVLGREAALQELARAPFDIVVSDIRLPGTELLARVRARYPETMSILLTDGCGFEGALRAINAGEINRVVTKPCNPMELTATIRELLQQKDRVERMRRMHRVLGELLERRAIDSAERAPLQHAIETLADCIAHVPAVKEDLTERERMEGGIGQSPRTVRAVFDSVRDGILVADAETKRFIIANNAICRMLDYSRDELLRLGVRNIHRVEDLPHVVEGFERVRRGEMPLATDVPMRRKDGSVFYVDINSADIEIGGRACMIGSFRDVTERLQMAEASQRHLRDLEESRDRIAAQSALLETQAKALVVARDAALAAVEAKSAFLANMSHEIRSPMNGIFGTIDLLLEMPLSSEQRELLEIARHSAAGLLEIINDILDLSKIEAGALALRIVEFDLATEVQDATRIVAQAAAHKGLGVQTTLDVGIPAALLGDPTRLRQILVNLLSNAVKFTKQGHVALAVTAAGESPTHVSVHFRVTDTGIGIAEKDRHRLFQSFSQIDGSSTRQHEGTGLGLVISRRLVEAMGGEIGVESMPGEGSTFWFTVRLQRANAAIQERAVKQGRQTSDSGPRGR